MRTRCILILVTLAVLGSSPAWASIAYDAYNDYSTTQNPNGTWEYGFADALGGPVTAFSQNTGSGSFTWYDPGYNPYSTPSVWKASGTLAFHPGPTAGAGFGQYTVIQWTAPQAGTVSVAAAFAGIDSGNKTVYVTDSANALPVFTNNINSFGSTSYSGVLPVTQGETIDFIVGPPYSFFSDSTAVSADITYVSSVPEPSTLIIGSVLGVCVIGLGWWRRKAA